MRRPSQSGLSQKEMGEVAYRAAMYRLKHPEAKPFDGKLGAASKHGLSLKALGKTEYMRRWRKLTGRTAATQSERRRRNLKREFLQRSGLGKYQDIFTSFVCGRGSMTPIQGGTW